MYGGGILISALVPAVIPAVVAVVVTILVEVATVAVGMEFATAIVPMAILATAILATVAVLAVEFARLVAGCVAELRGTAFPAGGIFPAAFLADLLGYDGAGALFALLLLAFAIVGVAFAFLAREEFLAFGLGAAA